MAKEFKMPEPLPPPPGAVPIWVIERGMTTGPRLEHHEHAVEGPKAFKVSNYGNYRLFKKEDKHNYRNEQGQWVSLPAVYTSGREAAKNLLVLVDDWIKSEEEKIAKARKHRKLVSDALAMALKKDKKKG